MHVFGNPLNDIDKLKKKCKELNIFLIEDCAESLGSYYLKKGKKIHTGVHGDISCFSFNGNKIVTAGSGGMLCTNNKIFEKRARYLSTTAKDNFYDFTHNSLGYNFSISNINACIGFNELKELDIILKKKKIIHNLYRKSLEKFSNIELIGHDIKNKESNYWLNVIKIKNKKNLNKDFMNFSKRNNFETRAVWKLLYAQKHLKKFNSSNCTKSKNFIKNCFCLPSGLELKKKNILKISNDIKNFLNSIK